ncbi:hypothetical protein ABDJ41_21565 [Pedobacter sp. ASV1-7]|uniref:hypothetical protein n=1 Tax=Pedobacter sp. ASV1-7 TaxID=3145237 RepID=UPI0032E902CA
MNLAYTMQKFQDWFTQQWVILRGKKFNPNDHSWLIGPFGELNGIGEDFIYQLAKKENLNVKRNCLSNGLLASINDLELSEYDLNRLSKNVIGFYEHTSSYKLQFKVKWNPFFRIFGYFVNRLFSQRINQLNIPIKNIHDSEILKSEIINLFNSETNEVKYTIWLRKFESTGKVIYSGIYGTCKIPSGKTCIKAIFPLPKGNATVIMKSSVGENNELILDSSGNKFGDAGFYFLLNDEKNNYWAQFISSFTDKLIVSEINNSLQATQTLKLWNLRVATFNYIIEK